VSPAPRQPPRGDEALWEYRLSEVKEDIADLKRDKASKESVVHIDSSVTELKEAFNALKRIIIGAALSWVAGSGMFLLGVLQIRGKG
jgi:hypothetical protein